MIGWLRQRIDAFIGAGEAALTIPVMDGALKPNRVLDDAQGYPIARPDCLAADGDRIFCSSGNEVFAVHSTCGAVQTLSALRFGDPVTAICAVPGGGLAVALESGELHIAGGARDGLILRDSAALPLRCVTALTFAAADILIVCIGSSTNLARDWRKDLLEGNASGSVWRIDLSERSQTRLADSLAFPQGIMGEANGRTIVVSESWRHRLVRLDAERPSKPEIVLDDLPGYPSRLCSDGSSGAWAAIFAPRNQLVEFVIREREYREEMMSTIAPDYWIAPALRSRDSFLEPLQGGGVRQMGMLKPWAPTRSYGLVVRLGADLQPVLSLHSRADGHRHGTTSCLVAGGRLFVACKGGDEILVHPVAP